MPTTPPPIKSCGTLAPGWLKGKHPSEDDGRVTRKVCYNWKNKICRWNNNIRVTNCGDYFVYELTKPPTCRLRYCGVNQGGFHFFQKRSIVILYSFGVFRQTFFSIVTSRHRKIPLNSRCHFFDCRNRYSSISLVKFLFSSHNLGEVAVIQKFKNSRDLCMGRPCWMAWHVVPYITLFNFGNIVMFELQLLRRNYNRKTRNCQLD